MLIQNELRSLLVKKDFNFFYVRYIRQDIDTIGWYIDIDTSPQESEYKSKTEKLNI